MLVAVIADTHIPRRALDLPPTAWRHIESADAAIHAGDVTEQALLEELARVKPLYAVAGNNDLTLAALPQRLELTLDGVHISVVHDSGPTAGRRERLRRDFPDARIVVFGHSHIPVNDDDGDLLLLNPGSPTDRRSMPTFTMATLTLRRGSVTNAKIIDLGLERAAASASARVARQRTR
ncbi:MAG: metallophosphoesterase family protein [Candidatus Dormibacteria bacterium]